MSTEKLMSNVASAAIHLPGDLQLDRNKAYEERIRKHYEIVESRPLLTKKTHYMNMGYWKDDPKNLDDACEALARFMGDFGQFCREDRILDAGCGFGDQDIYWANHHAPREIIGVNISQVQVESAQRRVHELGLQDRITIYLGSATNLPFADGSFDKVIALESAQHFGTREDFFREAHRVLRSGGQIYTSDIIPAPGMTIGNFALKAMALNKDNLYPREVYEQKLRDAAFTNVRVTSVRDFVLQPFKKYMDSTAENAPLVERLRRRISKLLVPTYKLDYVIASAEKN
jgi:erythromycin 3''-O-methyltransferase